MNPSSFSTLTNQACLPKSCSQTSSFSGMSTEPKRSGISFSFRLIFLMLMIFSRKCITIDTVTQSQGISVGQTLVSEDQMFELGFFSRGNSSFIGIWFKSVLNSNIVWVANRENPLGANDKNSSLEIGKDGNLRLVNGLNNVVWSTNVSSRPNNTIAVLSNKGDFTLYDNVSKSTLWESFNTPGDSLISGMSIATNNIAGGSRFLSSWKDENDPTPGIYVCGLTMETPPQVFIWKSSKPYWRTGPWDGWNFIGVSNMGGGYTNGLILTPDNQRGYVSISYNSPTSSRATVVVLTPDGILKMVHWDIPSQTQDGVTWQSMLVPCDVYGACGPFGVCDRNGTRSCNCLKGFVAKSREEWGKGNFSSGCVRRTELTCEMNTSSFSSSNAKNDKFLQLRSMKLPDHHTYIFGLNSSGCLEWCLRNCSCNAYAYSAGINCLVWSGDLVDTQKFSSTGTDLFLRLAYSEMNEKKTNMKLVISLTTISGVILLGICLFGFYRLRKTRKVKRRHKLRKIEESEPTTPLGSQPLWGNNTTTQTEKSDLPMFDFFTLSVATNHFSEGNKLGGGGFGPVFKGKLEDGLEIAVKRLSTHSGQGADEFKNEILLISKLQHRNLVKLLGYCIKGDEKLLIYEYLKNKSLDYFLFDTKSGALLDWDKRLNIIQGIARGLLYLHRDSRLRIIHRDLKSGNILLDDNMDPKISDFGLARAFEVTQELANTHRVVGTFGYMSPEYAMGGLFSEKSDVYSFGILLLEIISGRRNTTFYHNEKHNLLSYAWELWKEGKGLELIDPTFSGSCRNKEFLQCLHIAILCVQDHAVDRPTMSSVVLMLTSETDLPNPTPPTFYQKMLGSDLHNQSSSGNSVRDVTISQVEGR